jgi:hypothetical protein
MKRSALIWSVLEDDVRFRYCSFAAAILAVVILARIIIVRFGKLHRDQLVPLKRANLGFARPAGSVHEMRSLAR